MMFFLFKKQKNTPEFSFRGSYLILYSILLHQQLCNLNSVGSCALANLVAAAPQGNGVVKGKIITPDTMTGFTYKSDKPETVAVDRNSMASSPENYPLILLVFVARHRIPSPRRGSGAKVETEWTNYSPPAGRPTTKATRP